MTDFNVSPLRNSAVAYVARMRDQIEMDPIYQRQGEVWSREKQRLLIDSIINRFDIPKIYFHQHSAPISIDGRKVRYSLVDGRQRLEAIWDFLDGRLALANDFVHIEDGSTDAAGLTFRQLEERQPDIAALFSASTLDIMCIQTDDIELIEEMFSRLNEAVPLNAAEKRNGKGGPLRAATRGVAEMDFFTEKLPFGNSRYRHFDIATKFLRFVDRGGPTDTKKAQLDEFWERFRQSNDTARVENLKGRVADVLEAMVDTFEDRDKLLASVGMISLYFLYFLQLDQEWASAPRRDALLQFETVRHLNRYDSEDDLTPPQRELLEFDRLSQSPNDEGALKFRLNVLSSFLNDPSRYAAAIGT